jgi:hypothetical protein
MRICTFHQIILHLSNDGGAGYAACTEDEKFIEVLSGKSEGNNKP